MLYIQIVFLLQDFHHDVTLKKVLVEYLEGVRDHEYIQDKEMELAEALLK